MFKRNLTFMCIFSNILLRIHINVISHIIISLSQKIYCSFATNREGMRSAEKAA